MSEIKTISREESLDWILNKHYAKRSCQIIYSFGLFFDGILSGVCTFGYPPNYNYNNGNCVFENYRCLTLELNRLITNDDLPRNSLSKFVSGCLKKLPKPSCVVSYADPNNGHHGYIYQATNWIYTGTSTPKKRYVFSDGSSFDIRRGVDKKGEIVDVVDLLPTHRYIYFNGSKKQIKKMNDELKMAVLEYPKGNNREYDTSYFPNVQLKIF